MPVVVTTVRAFCQAHHYFRQVPLLCLRLAVLSLKPLKPAVLEGLAGFLGPMQATVRSRRRPANMETGVGVGCPIDLDQVQGNPRSLMTAAASRLL